LSISALNPETTSALIFGVSECPQAPSLQPLPQCANSAEDFEIYLRERLTLPQSHILNLFNSNDSSSEQLDKIDEWLKRATKEGHATDLLVYYTGHGAFSGGDQSYILAVRRTKQGLEGATSIRYSDLALCIKQQAPRARRYLILDCCFAASAVPRHQSNLAQTVIRKVEDELPPSGTALLCSSSARLVSLAPQGKRHTMFSGALLQCLNEGVAGWAMSLSLEDVGNRAREIIQEEYPSDAVRPELHVPDQQKGNPARVPLFPNKLYSEAQQRLPDTTTATSKLTTFSRASPRLIGVISGICSAVGYAWAAYPWGAPWAPGHFFPPIIPAICLTLALFIAVERTPKPTHLFAFAAAVWVSWSLAYNAVFLVLRLPIPILEDIEIRIIVLYGPAGFIGAFCLNLCLDVLVDHRRPKLNDLLFYAVRSLPFALLSLATALAIIFAGAPAHSLWASLALFVPWQLFIIEMRHSLPGAEGNNPRWFDGMPFGRYFVRALSGSLAFVAIITYLGPQLRIHILRAVSNDPIVFDIRSVTVADDSTELGKGTIKYLAAKTTSQRFSCRLQLRKGTEEPISIGPLTLFEKKFTDATADFEMPTVSFSSLSVRLACEEDNFKSEWFPLDLASHLRRTDGR
jgi:hypothetical protein